MFRHIFAISLLISVAYGQADSSEDPVRIGPGVPAPKPIRRPEPTYSPEALKAGIQGTVLLELVVDKQGLPTDIHVISPLGYGLDERAQECIKTWRFQPGLKNGSPVKILAIVQVNFRLTGAYFNAEVEKRRTEYNRALSLIKGDSKQKESAVKTFQDLAQKKFPAAMYAYGQLLAEGKDVPYDLEKSRDLISRAAQAKYGPAMFALASASLEEKGNSKAFKDGQEMMRDAAHLGSTQAQYFLGFAYEHSNPDLGIRQDEDAARQYYRFCAAVGHILCQYRLGDLLLNGPKARERDIPQAIAWLELSADQGEPQAKMLADRSRANLTPEQVKQVATLKSQLVHRD
jgi:TonB family protein